MSAIWWFHCNKCLTRPSANSTKFYIVKCGHVLCLRCLEKAKKACDEAKQPLHCICCKKKVVTAEEIGGKMNRRTMRFFKKMEETMREMTDEMKEIGSFQQMQINLMIKALTKKTGEKPQKSATQEKREMAQKERADQMERAARKARDELKELQEKHGRMKDEMGQLRVKLKEAQDKAAAAVAANIRKAEPSPTYGNDPSPNNGNFNFNLLHNSSTEGSVASTTTREMFLGSTGNISLDSALSPCIGRKNTSHRSFQECNDFMGVTTTPEMLGRSRSHSKSRSVSSHSGSPNNSIFIANRLTPSRNSFQSYTMTPLKRAPTHTSTPNYSYTRTRSTRSRSRSSAARAGTVKLGSIIPAGNIPRTLRTPHK